jgi:hypothetical protein
MIFLVLIISGWWGGGEKERRGVTYTVELEKIVKEFDELFCL